jgi:magnesium transporter
MSTPPRDLTVLSASPVSIRASSPGRMRSISPGEIEIPHHSPTGSRAFHPNDPHVRERQRTMDVDMAMQLSLARRDTLHSSPVSAFSASAIPSNQPAPDRTFDPTLPTQEEDIIPEFEQIEAGDVLAQDIRPSLSVEPLPQNATEDVAASNFGLPTYQANGPSSCFDFTRMEEFATTEKATLGLNAPTNARFSFSAVRGRAKVNVDSPIIAPAEEAVLSDQAPQSEDGPSSGQVPLRHRKLSQSNPFPRSHRKGIGGKMALFENIGQETPSFSPVTPDRYIPSGPSYDFVPGINIPSPRPNGGILNTGHDRPYRFSFYSNALSATIHARSLSELPADGQTFEQLFSGALSQPHTSPQPIFSPPYQETNKSSDNNTNYFSNVGSNGNGNRRGFIEKASGKGLNDMKALHAEQDMNTWWLDIQCPTDEEMKMLSKVFSIHPLTTEDILMEETREKIELFRNYYLVCFRSFDQDPYSPTHLEPLNMYIIVFREGILSVCCFNFFFFC